MQWHPTLSAPATTALAVLVLAAILAGFLWARRQLDPATPAGAVVLALRGAGFLLLLLLLLQPARLPPPQVVSARRLLAVVVDGSGSMSVPGGPGTTDGHPTTRLDEARALIREHRLLERATEVADLALYALDAATPGLTPIQPEALAELEPVGRQTDLAAAIEQTVRLHKDQDLAGLVLFSDGRHTQTSDVRHAAAAAKVPLYPVAIGHATEPGAEGPAPARADLAVESATAEPRIILGRAGQVVATIRAEGQAARQVPVQLLAGERVVAESTVAVNERQPRRQALFNVRPDALGTHRYTVRVPPEQNEADPTNNEASFSVEVVDPVNRLLYLDRLRFERRFLHPVLAARTNLRYAAVVPLAQDRNLVQGNDEQMKREGADLGAARLGGLKALILGDLPAAAIPAEQLGQVRAWVDAGGALLLLGGPQSLGADGIAGPLAELLPVHMAAPAPYVEAEVAVGLTADGAAHPAFQRTAANWDRAAPLLSRFEVSGAKPAATILFAGAAPASVPVVVSWRVGHGKVAIVLTDSTWRWQLGHRGPSSAGGTEHGRFWQQMIDWLLPDLSQAADQAAAVQLIADRSEYEVGDSVTMMVTVRSADGSAVPDAQVDLRIATPDPAAPPIARSATAQTSHGQSEDLVYTATFDSYAPGEYAIAAVARAGDRTLGTDRTQVRVVQPLVEFRRTDPDAALLGELAQISGGALLDPADLDDLARIARLAPRRVLVQPSADKDAQPVWDRWWLLALFMLLTAGEWAVRRANQWV